MKNKGTTIFLFIAVLFIWGLLIYKIYHSVHGSGINKQRSTAVKHEDNYVILPSYKIHSYPRDPFLAILTDTATEPIVVEEKIKTPIIKPIVTLPQYFGLIESSKKKTAIFKFNKKIFFVHEGEIFQTLRIKNIATDSVIVLSEGKKVTIPLNKKKKT